MAKRVEFDAPSGWVSPEGVGENEDIELMASVRVKPGGRLCLVELDGIRMPGYRKDDDDGKTYAQASSEAYDEGDAEKG